MTRHVLRTATLHRRRGSEAKDAARPVSGASTWKSRSRRQRGLRRLRRARRAHDHSALGSVGSTRSTQSPRPGPKPRPRTGRGASEPSSAIEEAAEDRDGVAVRTLQRFRPDFADTSGRTCRPVVDRAVCEADCASGDDARSKHGNGLGYLGHEQLRAPRSPSTPGRGRPTIPLSTLDHAAVSAVPGFAACRVAAVPRSRPRRWLFSCFGSRHCCEGVDR